MSDASVTGSTEGRLELMTAILLGLAAMATAWAAYQASQYDGKVLESFTTANLNVSDSNAFYSEGDQIYLEDQLLFIEYAKAANSDDVDLALYLRETLMNEQLVSALEWWELPENIDRFDSPFVEENPNYVIESYASADALSEETDAAFEEGKEAGETGDTYNLIAVVRAPTTRHPSPLVQVLAVVVAASSFVGDQAVGAARDDVPKAHEVGVKLTGAVGAGAALLGLWSDVGQQPALPHGMGA
jgi:hypothetical protein